MTPGMMSDGAAARLRLAHTGLRWLRAVTAGGIVVCLGLALGACSKCDVPNLIAPHACHDGLAPQ